MLQGFNPRDRFEMLKLSINNSVVTSLSVAVVTEERCCVAAAFTQHRAGIRLAVVWTHRAELAELVQVGEKLEAGHRIRAVRFRAQDHR